MQQHGDRPVRGGRPSLLAPEEQAAPERQGILSSLDGLNAPAAPARAAPVRSRRWAWVGAAAAGAVVVGGALFLFADGEGDERRTQTLAAATPAETPAPPAAPPAAPVAVAAARAEAPAAAPAPAASEPAAPESAAPASASAAAASGAPVPAGAMAPAALHASAPAVVHDAAPAAMANPLAELAPPPRAKGDTKGDTRRAADRHAADRHASDKRVADKHADERQAAQKRKSRPQDSDVVLLTALMSHIDPKTRKATPAEQLESCKRYNAAGEEQCRIRVCTAAGRKEPACKHVPVAPPET